MIKPQPWKSRRFRALSRIVCRWSCSKKKKESLSLSLVEQSQTIREIRSIERLNFFLSLIPKKKKRISFYQRFFKKEKYHPLDSTISYISIVQNFCSFFWIDFHPRNYPRCHLQKNLVLQIGSRFENAHRSRATIDGGSICRFFHATLSRNPLAVCLAGASADEGVSAPRVGGGRGRRREVSDRFPCW